MKVIVSDTPLTVEDKEGNLLFQWFPKSNYILDMMPKEQMVTLHKGEKILSEKEIKQLLKEKN